LDKTITTALLIIAGVVCSIFLFNSVFPMVNRSSQAVVSMADQIDDRMKSRISIVHAVNTEDRKTVYIWVKNVGTSRIVAIDNSDVFFGQEGNYSRIPYTGEVGGVNPCWSFTIENGSEWLTSATLKITITYDSDPGAGTYFLKVIIPNGISDEYYFSM
jgi:archaeal flagellar protein FlaG